MNKIFCEILQARSKTPSSKPAKQARRYSPRTLARCLQDVREKKFSIRKASELYKVPKSTIADKITGKSIDQLCTPGPECVLGTNVEEKLAKYIIEQAERGFPLTKYGVRLTVIELIETSLSPSQQRKLPFINGPGRGWMRSFFKRHPDLTEKTSEYLSTTRSKVSETSIRQWFNETERLTKEEAVYDVLQEPSRVFNLDETAVWINPQNGKFIAKRGRRLSRVNKNSVKDNITALFNISAAGQIVPPLYVFPYKRLPKIYENIPNDAGFIRRTDNGWMDGATFFYYMSEDFYPWLLEHGNNIKMPVVVFMDGHYSHMNMKLSKWCALHGIHLLCLPPATTHILQPLDKSVFKPLKAHWREELFSFERKEKRNIDKHEVPELLLAIIKSCDMNGAIVNGFRSTGLYPFCADNVDYSLCLERPDSDDYDANETLVQMVERLIPRKYLEKLRDMKEKGLTPSRSDRFTVFDLWLRMLEQPSSHTILIPLEPSPSIVDAMDNTDAHDSFHTLFPEGEEEIDNYDEVWHNMPDMFGAADHPIDEFHVADKQFSGDAFCNEDDVRLLERGAVSEGALPSAANTRNIVIQEVQTVSPSSSHNHVYDSFGILSVAENVEVATDYTPSIDHGYCGSLRHGTFPV